LTNIDIIFIVVTVKRMSDEILHATQGFQATQQPLGPRLIHVSNGETFSLVDAVTSVGRRSANLTQGGTLVSQGREYERDDVEWN